MNQHRNQYSKNNKAQKKSKTYKHNANAAAVTVPIIRNYLSEQSQKADQVANATRRTQQSISPDNIPEDKSS